MKNLLVFSILVLITVNSFSQAPKMKNDSIQYKYCELFASPKVFSDGLFFNVKLVSLYLDEFKADTIFAPLLMEKDKPTYSTITDPLNILGQRGWRLIHSYSTNFRGVIFDHYILEKKVKIR